MGDARSLQKAVNVFKGLQQEMQSIIQTRAQLLQQVTETEMVKEELARLDEGATVFKLIGPALVKQDLVEATANVAKRLEYIQGEVGRINARLAGLEAKSNEQQEAVMKLQAAQQQKQQQAAVPVS